MAKDLAIILNNGSVNSAVTTAIAAQKFRPVMLYADVGAAGVGRMRGAYDLQVAHFKPYREHTLEMPFLHQLSPAKTTDAVAADPRSVVPVAPLLLELLPLVAVAARYAAHYSAAAVFLCLRVGGAGDELAQVTEYTQIWTELLQMPCGRADLTVEMPLLELDAWQVVDVGFNVAAPFEKTWSCLEAGGEPCWACRGCRAREAAFQQAGKADPMRTVRKL